MKLADINSVSKKLKSQVQKSGVAAGKAARTELGVLGISIGQERPTGITSRVNEEIEGGVEWKFLLDIAAQLKYPLYKEIEWRNVNKAEACTCALALVRVWSIKDDLSEFNKLCNALEALRRNYLSLIYTSNELTLGLTKLKKHSIVNVLPSTINTAVESSKHAAKQSVPSTVTAILNIIEFVDYVWEVAHHDAAPDSDGALNVVICKAALKRLNLKV